jgi:membrane protease YdiL (CAAX protease family)
VRIAIEDASTNSRNRIRAIWALVAIVPAPTLGLLAALYIWPDTALGQLLYAVCKGWLFALPLVWVVVIDRHRPKLPRLRSRGMGEAVLTGLLMFATIVGAYVLLGDWIDTEGMVRQIQAVGLGVLSTYLLAALYWCTVNSILEEYVWRWFVFTRCEALMPRAVAVAAAGLFFTTHHALALMFYFDWRVTLLGSLGVFIGGATWSWLYLRWRNIYAAYVSHVFADLAVFGVGWHLVFANGGA